MRVAPYAGSDAVCQWTDTSGDEAATFIKGFARTPRVLPCRGRTSPGSLLVRTKYDHASVESTGREPLPVAEARVGRRTALTFPLLPPPQKN